MNATGRERAPDQGPVGLDEAHRPGDRNIPDEVAHDVDLFEYTVDQFRAITPANDELLDAWAKDATLDLQLRPSLVPLGIDHPDPFAGYSDMVDVRLRTGDASVVKDSEVIGGHVI